MRRHQSHQYQAAPNRSAVRERSVHGAENRFTARARHRWALTWVEVLVVLAVLALVAQGLTNRQIAVKLYLGEGTVRNYVSSVLAKIGVSNRAEAAAYAVKHNINEVMPPSSGDEH